MVIKNMNELLMIDSDFDITYSFYCHPLPPKFDLVAGNGLNDMC